MRRRFRMERIKKTMDKCFRAIQRAPPNVSKKLDKLFRRLYDFLKENPEFSERTLPILLRLHRYILEGNYTEAIGQLFLLLVLIAVRKRKK